MTESDREHPERLLKTAEVAERFGVSRSAVCRWVRQGKLAPTFTPGGNARYRWGDIGALVVER